MEIITLIAAYVIPLIFILWIWLKPNVGTALKILISLALPLFYFLHWQGLQDYKGWPASQTLPEKFELITADVVEPTKQNGNKGMIYLWVRPGTDSASEPRAYGLPYTRKLHKMLFETKKRIVEGRQQIGLMLDEEGGEGSAGAEVGNGRKLEFVDKPKRQLPPKN